MEKVLITGSSGLLGSNACLILNDTYRVVAQYNNNLPIISTPEKVKADISDEDTVRSMLSDAAPDIIFHSAGMTNVDQCEKDPELATRVNIDGTRNLVKHMNNKCVIVYISTDSVYTGTKGLYVESDETGPINHYAYTKRKAEEIVQQYTDNSLIIRTNFFGFVPPYRRGFIQWILSELSANRIIKAADDWYFTPIVVNSLIETITNLLHRGEKGIYNIASSNVCSKYEFSIETARVMNLDESLIERVSIDTLPFHAPRPRNMTLDCSFVTEILQTRLPTYSESISRFKELMQNDYSRGTLLSFARI